MNYSSKLITTTGIFLETLIFLLWRTFQKSKISTCILNKYVQAEMPLLGWFMMDSICNSSDIFHISICPSFVCH